LADIVHILKFTVSRTIMTQTAPITYI